MNAGKTLLILLSVLSALGAAFGYYISISSVGKPGLQGLGIVSGGIMYLIFLLPLWLFTWLLARRSPQYQAVWQWFVFATLLLIFIAIARLAF